MYVKERRQSWVKRDNFCRLKTVNAEKDSGRRVIFFFFYYLLLCKKQIKDWVIHVSKLIVQIKFVKERYMYSLPANFAPPPEATRPKTKSIYIIFTLIFKITNHNALCFIYVSKLFLSRATPSPPLPLGKTSPNFFFFLVFLFVGNIEFPFPFFFISF